MPATHGGHSYPHLLIRASAGTGKTFQLSNRFLQLLRDGVAHDRILATTFTRKAAGEILDRVILRLAEATQRDDKLKELARFTGDERFSRDECLRLLQDTMRQLHRLRVSTLDSLFAQIARSFSLELGLPPGWQIVEEWSDARLRAQAVATILAQDEAADLRTLMNLLTKGEAKRSVSELILETVNSLYNLFLETAAPAWHAIPRTKPLNDVELAATLEQLQTATLTGKRLVDARDADCQRALQGDWEEFLGKGLAAKVASGELTYFKQAIPDDVVAIYERLIAHVKATLVGRVALQTEATYELLRRFHSEYQRLKVSQRALRFEDITRQLSNLDQLADPDRLTFRLDSRLDHLLLDEFQDTSPVQWRVLKPLGERLTSSAGGYSFFCVGDVKQAIYGWRGGEAAIFDAIDAQLQNLTPSSLSTSYRSAPPVIETVNTIFSGLTKHPNLGRAEAAVRRWSAAFETHHTKRSDLPGYVEFLTGPRPAEGESGDAVLLGFAADKIAELVAAAPGRHIGVLVRTNQTVGQLIFELRQRGVAASEEGGNPLTDSAAVLTILSALRMADHPADTVARFHVASGPLGSVLHVSDQRDDAAARAAAQHIRHALTASGYGPTLYGWSEQLAASCSPRELSRLEQLVELAYEYDAQATLRTSDFISYVESTRVSAATPADVRVMTIHQSKGLEFDIVVLPELDAGLLGHADAFVIERRDVTGPVERVCRYASADIQALLPAAVQRMFAAATERSVSEALCVLYVAVTRAVQALYGILPPSKKNERSLPNNFAGLLRAALKDDQPVEPGTVIYRCGDPGWYARSGQRPPIADTAAPAEAVVVRLAPVTEKPRRGWERARPSGLEGGPRVRVQDVLRSERSAAFLRGQLFHAWFEQVQWLDDDRPSDGILRTVAAKLLAQADIGDLDVEKELKRFHALLDTRAVSDSLSRGRYQQLGPLGFPPTVVKPWRAAVGEAIVQNERTFAVRDGEQLLAGSIDRLVLLRQGERTVAAEVFDYKTDSLAAGDPVRLAEKVAFYTPQLQAYRRAVAQFSQLPPSHVLAWLIFVEPGIVASVPESAQP